MFLYFSGLFHKVILQSGSALNVWALARQPKRAAFAMGKVFGIETNDSATLIAGLRNISGLDLTVIGLSQTFAVSTVILFNFNLILLSEENICYVTYREVVLTLIFNF